MKNRLKIDFKMDHQLEAEKFDKIGPSWSQVAIKIHFQVDEKIRNYFGASWARFWMVLGAKMESKRELKIRSRKT